jgi:hypothetical protein
VRRAIPVVPVLPEWHRRPVGRGVDRRAGVPRPAGGAGVGGRCSTPGRRCRALVATGTASPAPTVADLVAAACGRDAKVVVIARETTAADANRARGVRRSSIVAPTSRVAGSAEQRALVAELVRELPPARAARVAAAITGAPRDELYALAVALRADPPASD